MKGLPTEVANAPMRAMRFARGLLIMATWHDHRILLLASWCTYLGDGTGERCEEMGFERGLLSGKCLTIYFIQGFNMYI